MRTICVVLLIALLLVAQSDARQMRDQSGQAAVGTGVITGVVTTRGDTPVPVRRAVMSLAGGPLRTSLLAVTDNEGRFAFRNLPTGRFTLDARKSGFVREVYGASTIGATEGVQISVGDGSTEVSMSLVRSAAFSGQVLLPPGAPVASIRLQVLRWDVMRGRRQLVSARGGALSIGGDGRYRIGGLPPGEYVIVAYPFGRSERQLFGAEGPGAIVNLAPVYLPGTVDPAQAEAVRLAAGEERVIDLTMNFVQTGRVEGRVFGTDGAPMAGAQVSVESALPAVPQLQAVRTAADGTFAVPSVVAGAYTIVARGAPASWANASLIVTPGSTVQGIDLRLQPGRAVRGRVEHSPGEGTVVNVSSLYVTLAADDDAFSAIGVPMVQPGADKTFALPGVAPGRYRLQVTIPEVLQKEVLVVGMRADGQDVLDDAITVGSDRDVDVTITVSTTPSVVEVSVRDAEGLAQAGRSLVVFARDPALRLVPSRRVVFTRANADGLASVRGLPDGAYLVAALTEIPGTPAQTPDWFESLAAAAKELDVRDGRTTTTTITIGR